MSAETKTYEDKMTGVINHLVKEHATIRAGRANPAILDKVTVDYYGTPTPINQVAPYRGWRGSHGPRES